MVIIENFSGLMPLEEVLAKIKQLCQKTQKPVPDIEVEYEDPDIMEPLLIAEAIFQEQPEED